MAVLDYSENHAAYTASYTFNFQNLLEPIGLKFVS